MMGEHFQLVTFAIHVIQQPNVPCGVQGCNVPASWMAVRWSDGTPEMSALAFCDTHQKPLKDSIGVTLGDIYPATRPASKD